MKNVVCVSPVVVQDKANSRRRTRRRITCCHRTSSVYCTILTTCYEAETGVFTITGIIYRLATLYRLQGIVYCKGLILFTILEELACLSPILNLLTQEE